MCVLQDLTNSSVAVSPSFGTFDVSSFIDGRYDFGLQVTCKGTNYITDVVSIIFDRQAPKVVAGSLNPPTPVTHFGTEVSASFTEPIDCMSATITLALADGTVLNDYSRRCSGNTMFIEFTAQQVNSRVSEFDFHN
jgi:hypothetical protein